MTRVRIPRKADLLPVFRESSGGSE